MSKEELKEMKEAAIEQKLFEMLGDPDDGSDLSESVRDRLLRQRQPSSRVIAANLLRVSYKSRTHLEILYA
jgi:hypothetical protein